MDSSKAEIEEAKRPRHWTDAVSYVCGLAGFVAFLFFLAYILTH